MILILDFLHSLTDGHSVFSESPLMLNPSSASSIYDISAGDRRPAGLVRRFGDLYSMARLDTLDDLDAIEELRDAHELKNKLLFSVVVVSLKKKIWSATIDAKTWFLRVFFKCVKLVVKKRDSGLFFHHFSHCHFVVAFVFFSLFHHKSKLFAAVFLWFCSQGRSWHNRFFLLQRNKWKKTSPFYIIWTRVRANYESLYICGPFI